MFFPSTDKSVLAVVSEVVCLQSKPTVPSREATAAHLTSKHFQVMGEANMKLASGL